MTPAHLQIGQKPPGRAALLLKSAGKMSGHGIGRANGSAGSRIDAGGSWPSLNRSGPASRRPAQPALGVMGAVRS